MIVEFIYSNPVWLWASLFIIIATSMVSLGLIVFHRLVDPILRKSHNDIAVGMLTAITTAYAVLIALVALSTFDSYNKAVNNAQMEASHAGNIFRSARGLPPAVMKPIQEQMVKYLNEVVQQEWPAQHAGKIEQIKQNGWLMIAEAEKILMDFNPSNFNDSNLQLVMLNEFNNLFDMRRARILSNQPSTPPVMWWVIALGGFIIILYCNFLGAEHFGLQLVMTGMATLSLLLIVILIITLDRPFRGNLVQPTEFSAVLLNSQGG